MTQMRRRCRCLLFLGIVVVTALLITACGSNKQEKSQQEASESSTANPTSQDLNQREDNVMEATEKKEISVEDAKKIALEKAGIPAEEAVFIQIKADDHEDQDVYDFEFISGANRYEVKVTTDTGAVVNYKMNSVEKLPAQLPDGIISSEQAKEIVLTDASAAPEEVVFVKIELDNDDGQYRYEIDFVYQSKDYEYEINADTGSIIEREIDFAGS